MDSVELTRYSIDETSKQSVPLTALANPQVEVTFRWETEAHKTPRLFVLDGDQVVFAGAML